VNARSDLVTDPAVLGALADDTTFREQPLQLITEMSRHHE
jgi:hypothetical protein